MQDGTQATNVGSDGFASIPDVPVDAIAERVTPKQVATGNERGTRKMVNIDGSYITWGLIPDGGTDFGIAFFTADNKLISKTTGVTDYKYDKLTGRNYYQNGLLPDGSYGEIITKAPYNVKDAFN